jgi:hypothetical protein
MQITVSSGNVAHVTVLAAGNRVAVDVEWRKSPTSADIEHLTQLLSLGGEALNISIEDDQRRAEFTRRFLFDSGESGRVQ